MPAPLCLEPPRAEDDRLVVRWNYTHTGGQTLTAAGVYFYPDTSPELRMPLSSVSGAEVGSVSSAERADSIPLPEAGLHYQFTVSAENSNGTTETNCPLIRLDIGECVCGMVCFYFIVWLIVLKVGNNECVF